MKFSNELQSKKLLRACSVCMKTKQKYKVKEKIEKNGKNGKFWKQLRKRVEYALVRNEMKWNLGNEKEPEMRVYEPVEHCERCVFTENNQECESHVVKSLNSEEMQYEIQDRTRAACIDSADAEEQSDRG